uniref:Uncharacterized protein n=1 Tax=Anopheles christyi TaxID=43041 RepID=A0A182KI99_9DIPT
MIAHSLLPSRSMPWEKSPGPGQKVSGRNSSLLHAVRS